MKDLVSRHNCPEIVAFTIRTVSAAAVRARVEYNASVDSSIPFVIREAPHLQSRSILLRPAFRAVAMPCRRKQRCLSC